MICDTHRKYWVTDFDEVLFVCKEFVSRSTINNWSSLLHFVAARFRYAPVMESIVGHVVVEWHYVEIDIIVTRGYKSREKLVARRTVPLHLCLPTMGL